MTQLAFDVYPRSDPRDGTRLVRLTNQDYLDGTGYQAQRRGAGAGTIILSALHSAVAAGYLAEGNYVRVVDLDLGASGEVVGGIWLNEGEVVVLSDKEGGGKTFKIGGQGPLYYLHNAVIPAEARSPSAGPQDQFNIDTYGKWRWGVAADGTSNGETFGGILRRVILEAWLDDPSGIPAIGTDLTDAAASLDWSDVHDSNGAVWPSTDGLYEITVGDNLLDVTATLMAEGIDLRMDPDTFVITAYIAGTDGTDRTGASFGAGVVRFAGGVNIASDLKRAIHESVYVSHMRVIGDDAVTFVEVVDPDWSVGDPVVWGSIQLSVTHDTASMTLFGLHEIAARKLQTDQATFPHVPGDDESAGAYTPGPVNGHYWLGDLVTIHTGTAEHDYNEQSIEVGAISYILRDAGDWDIQVELGSNYIAFPNGTSFQGGGPGICDCGPTLRLCDAGTGAATVEGGEAFATGGPPPASTGLNLTIASGGNLALYVFVQYNPAGGGGGGDITSVTWHPSGDPGDDQALTLVDSVVHPTSTVSAMAVYRLLSPTPSLYSLSSIEVIVGGSFSETGLGAVVVSGVDQSNPDNAVGKNSGTGTTTSVTVAAPLNGVVINAGGWLNSSVTPTLPTAVAGQTSLDASSGAGTSGTGSVAIGIGYGDATPGWALTDSRDWCAIAVPVNAATGGDALNGTSPTAARCDHKTHAGDVIFNDGSNLEDEWATVGTPDAADVAYGNSTSGMTATDAQAALDELDDRVDTLEAATPLTNPMTTQDDLIIGGASGTPTRLAKGTDGQVLTVDPVTHHLLWIDPTTGGATELDDLTDVDTSTVAPSDGDVLTYDSGSGLWVPAAPTGGGGGGITIQYPALKPTTPTYDFNGASLHADFSAQSQSGSFTTSHVMTQGAEWGGSSVELQFSNQRGQIYVAHANTDFDFTVGGIFKAGFTGSWMFGIAALNSSGTGVGITSYNDGNAYFATISSYTYSSFSDSWTSGGHVSGSSGDRYWFRLKRVSGTWTGYVSRSGRAWDKTFTTRADSITVDRLVFGVLFDNVAYSGVVGADYFQVDV